MHKKGDKKQGITGYPNNLAALSTRKKQNDSLNLLLRSKLKALLDRFNLIRPFEMEYCFLCSQIANQRSSAARDLARLRKKSMTLRAAPELPEW